MKEEKKEERREDQRQGDPHRWMSNLGERGASLRGRQEGRSHDVKEA